MKGLLCIGGRQPDPVLAVRIAGTNDICVAADSGLESALSLGIRPDYIVGDMDSISDRSLLAGFPEDRILIYPSDKDETDTELALRLLLDKGVDEIVLVGGSGGRLDHILSLRALFERTAGIPSLWIDEETVTVACGTGSAYSGCDVQNLAATDPVSVFPAGASVHESSSEGFFWNPDSVSWDRNEYSLSNKSVTGSVRFFAEKGLFLLMFPLSATIEYTPIRKQDIEQQYGSALHHT